MLTKKQLQLYNFIKNYIEENKISPSYDEMKNFLNLKSKSGIFHYLNSIEKLGYIRKINKKSRIVEIVKNRDEFFDLKEQLSSIISENKRFKEKLKKAEEKIKKLTEGLEIISTFVCIPDEDTEEQVMATHRMCGDLLEKVNKGDKDGN